MIQQGEPLWRDADFPAVTGCPGAGRGETGNGLLSRRTPFAVYTMDSQEDLLAQDDIWQLRAGLICRAVPGITPGRAVWYG